MSDTITVRLPDDLRTKLKSTSKKANLTVGQVVREAVRRYLAVERFRQLRAETIPYAERAGFFTDEDILKKHK